MDQKKVGAALKQLRKEKGLTQEQLAEQFYVSARTVSRWETGNYLPGVDMLIDLADFYQVDIHRLLGEEAALQDADTLKQVAHYAARKEKKTDSRLALAALCICTAVLVGRLLFGRPTQGLFYGVLPEQLCGQLLMLIYGTAAAAVVAFLKAWGFQEKPEPAPERTVKASVLSREVKPGTHGAGRSKGGFSYTVTFRTEQGQELELFAYETEFGGLKEGTQGLLTHRGRYFVRFQKEA